MKLEAAGASEKGIHLRNQDAFLADAGRGIFAVADGVTTVPGSWKASRAAVECFRSFHGDLAEVFFEAHRKVKMGAGATTLTAARIKGRKLQVCHVGDSCLLLVRGQVEKVTEDDSLEGSSLLTQVVGKGSMRPHTYTRALRKGDCILLLTDGVANHVDGQDILGALRLPIPRVPAELIRIAKGRRKLYEDDKTVVAVRAL